MRRIKYSAAAILFFFAGFLLAIVAFNILDGRSGILTAKAQNQMMERAKSKQCNAGTIKGRYGAVMEGWDFGFASPTPIQMRWLGIIEFDGKDTAKENDLVVSMNGQIFLDSMLTFNYVVNADCTMSGTATTPFGPASIRGIIFDEGKEIRSMQAMTGTLFTAYLRKLD